MSLPRLGWNDSWGCVYEALYPFRIPVHRHTGVFWGQCMTRSIQKCLDDGVDLILTIDYDSMFTSRDVDALCNCIAGHPEYGAVAALQTKRNEESPLFTLENGALEAQVQNGVPLEVATAHFGLTLISADAIRKMQKPWFVSKPDEGGEWGDNRIDEDIHFWRAFREAGNKVAMCPDAKIGHLELFVTGYSPTFQYERLTVKAWKDRANAALQGGESLSARPVGLPEGNGSESTGVVDSALDSAGGCGAGVGNGVHEPACGAA